MSSFGVAVGVGEGVGEGEVGEEEEMREKHVAAQLPVEGRGRATVWRRDSVDARWIWTVGDEPC